MSTNQYACPKCGVALESAQDVSGRKVRCLGCFTVFVAGGDRPEPKRASRRAAPEPVQQYVPPLPRSRRVPVGGVLAGGGAVAPPVRVALFFGMKYKNRLDDNESKVAAQKNANEKAIAAVKTVQPKTTPSKAPSEPVTPRKEEEEEAPVVPAVSSDSGTKPSDSGNKPRDP